MIVVAIKYKTRYHLQYNTLEGNSLAAFRKVNILADSIGYRSRVYAVYSSHQTDFAVELPAITEQRKHDTICQHT